MPPGAVAIAIIMTIFLGTIILTAIGAWHRQELEKIRTRKSSEGNNTVSEAVLAELAQMKEQLLALRDTTTKFDLSFDASLDKLEERLQRVEERQLTQTYGTAEDAARLTLGR